MPKRAIAIVSLSLFSLIISPVTLFSQIKKKDLPGGKEQYVAAIRYYKTRTGFSRHYIKQYARLILGISGYNKKDTLLAGKLLGQLPEKNEQIIYAWMRIKLEWELKQRFIHTPIDPKKFSLKNNSDSAIFYFMMASYQSERIDSIRARRLGFVKSGPDGIERVDWKKIKSLDWADWRWIEGISICGVGLDPDPYAHAFVRPKDCDDCTAWFKKAIEKDNEEFYYMQEWLFFLTQFRAQDGNREMVLSLMNKFSVKQKAWVNQYLNRLYARVQQ